MKILATNIEMKLAILFFESVKGRKIKARERKDIENASSLPSKVKS